MRASLLILAPLLLVAASADVAWRRIPNALVVAVACCGAAVSLVDPAAPPLRSGGLAVLIALVCTIPLWRASVIGAGDVKLFAAVGTWTGVGGLGTLAAVTAVAGGILALVYSVAGGTEAARIRPMSVSGASLSSPLAAMGPERRRSIPYGIAIAVGALYVVAAR